jgi:hypothetical protein
MKRYEVLWLYNDSHVYQTMPFFANADIKLAREEVAQMIERGEIEWPKYPPAQKWEIKEKPEYGVLK